MDTPAAPPTSAPANENANAEPDASTPRERLDDLLGASHVVKVATSGGPATPWVAAAFFAEDGLFALELMLEERGHTLSNLLADPRVAVMLEHGDAFAVFAQGAGRARVVHGAEAQFRERIAAKAPESAMLVSLPGLVPVRVEIGRWWVTDVRAGWLPARQIACDGADAGE